MDGSVGDGSLLSPTPLKRRPSLGGGVSPLNWLRSPSPIPSDEPLSARSMEEVRCTTPTGPKLRHLPTSEDPDVLCFGDELRLWAVSEYAVQKQSDRPPKPQRTRSASDASHAMTSADVGGYVGTFFKDRKRRARTGRQPLACVPPVGNDAGGGFVETAFTCVDPRGLKREGQPVRIGDVLILQSADGHVWNSMVSGVVGYLAPRLRGERGETRVRFADDVKSTRSFGDKPESGRAVRFGDSLNLVTCPANSNDPTHPGRGGQSHKSHVLTCFKKETSSLLGGYLTIDPRGFALSFTVERPPPALDVVVVGSERHHRVAWGQAIPFSGAAQVALRLSSSGSAACALGDLGAGDRRWLKLEAPGASTPRSRTANFGHVLLEMRRSQVQDDEEEVSSEAPVWPFELTLVWFLAQVGARLLFAPQLASSVAAAASSALASVRNDASLARPSAVVAFASSALAALATGLLGDAATTALTVTVLLSAALTAPSAEAKRPKLLRALSRRVPASGELALLQWSPEDDDALITCQTNSVKHKGKRDVPSASELSDVDELRDELKKDAPDPRWLETGELLRFVRARKTLKDRAGLFREAMAWRKDHVDVYGGEVDGSFGSKEQRWCVHPEEAPAWWRFMTENIPFELFGADAVGGVPITFVGLGRMDLGGISREIGLDKIERKLVLQNDAFIDLARREGLRRSTDGETVVTHGGVNVIDCDGFGRRHLGEVRVFQRCAAALKVLHPERQRKTFIVRAPRIFAIFWKIVRAFLDERIISKISILGVNDDLTPLIDELGAEHVPTLFGGAYELKCSSLITSHELVPLGAFKKFAGND